MLDGPWASWEGLQDSRRPLRRRLEGRLWLLRDVLSPLLVKTAPASIDGSPTQRLRAVWGSKMGFKALPEGRKIFIWICIFTCEVALRRYYKR